MKNHTKSLEALTFLLCLLVSPIFSYADSGIILKEKEHHLNGTLSEFWAQEYTGSDLLRQELSRSDFSNSNITVAVIDTELGHGVKVKSLISTQRAGSIFKNLPIIHLYGDHKARMQDLIKESNFPSFINESFQWRDSFTSPTKDYLQIAGTLSENGSTIVTSAGNCFKCGTPEVNIYKRTAANEHNVLLVSAMSENGEKDPESQIAQEVLVSAPGGEYVRAYENDGKKSVLFGRTSAATPQVTSALSTFSIILSYKPTKEEIKILIEETSLKIPNVSSFEGKIGAGLLNAYKVGKVALKIKDSCGKENVECIKDAITSKQTYSFEESYRLQQAYAYWPRCLSENPSDILNALEQASTEDNLTRTKKSELKKLRSELLLRPNNPQGWQLLSCIYENEGFSVNAEFYSNLSEQYIQDIDIQTQNVACNLDASI